MNGRSDAGLLKSMAVMLGLLVKYDAYLSSYGVILGYSTACSWSASRGACSSFDSGAASSVWPWRFCSSQETVR